MNQAQQAMRERYIADTYRGKTPRPKLYLLYRTFFCGVETKQVIEWLCAMLSPDFNYIHSTQEFDIIIVLNDLNLWQVFKAKRLLKKLGVPSKLLSKVKFISFTKFKKIDSKNYLYVPYSLPTEDKLLIKYYVK